jgi:hypothetical protein
MKALTAALIAKLEADATLMALVTGGVHRTVKVLDNATCPYLVVQKTGARIEYTWKSRLMSTYTYLFLAVGRDAGAEGLDDILARVDALLTDGSLTVTGYTKWLMRHTADIQDTVTENSGMVYRSGAEYQIILGG